MNKNITLLFACAERQTVNAGMPVVVVLLHLLLFIFHCSQKTKFHTNILRCWIGFMHALICVCIYIHICIYKYMYVYVSIYVLYILHTHVRMYVRTCVFVYAYVHLSVSVCLYVCMYVCENAYRHIFIYM